WPRDWSSDVCSSDLLLADVGLALVVAVDDLDLEPADLAPQVIERQLDGILHVLADDAGRARERGDEPDLDGLGGAGDLAREQPRHETENHAEPQCTHADLLGLARNSNTPSR